MFICKINVLKMYLSGKPLIKSLVMEQNCKVQVSVSGLKRHIGYKMIVSVLSF